MPNIQVSEAVGAEYIQTNGDIDMHDGAEFTGVDFFENRERRAIKQIVIVLYQREP